MNKAELVEILQDVPDSAEILIKDYFDTDITYKVINKVTIQTSTHIDLTSKIVEAEKTYEVTLN